MEKVMKDHGKSSLMKEIKSQINQKSLKKMGQMKIWEIGFRLIKINE